MEITITKLTGEQSLHCHYQGQINAQDCYIELDTETGEMSADSNSEIGNAVPSRVWHGITRRYTIPTLTADAANDLMEELLPLAQRVIDGSKVVWDGNNHVGGLNDDAEQAEIEIEQYIERIETDETNAISDVDASDWLYAIKSETEGKTDEELKKMAEEYEANAESENIALNGDVLQILTDWRDQYAEELTN